jgi:hypothetical protein
MADVLVHTGYANGESNKLIKVYVTWSSSQDIANNRSTITCGMYVTTPSSTYSIGPWSDVAGSYVGTTSLTFDGAIPNFKGTRTLTSGKQFTVNHNPDGSASATIYWKWGVNSSWGGCQKPSGSFNITLPQIPRQANLTAAPNFNDEENPTISYSNPAGNSVSSLQACISLTGSTDDIAYRDVSKTGTSYTFNLTTAERNLLRNNCTTSNNRNVTFFLRTVIGGNTFHSTITKSLSIVNATPTLNPTVTDSNSTTVALTGSNNKLVKYYSNAAFSFGAAALKGASITSYSLTNGAKSSTSSSGTLNAIESNSFVFKVTDSRGNTATQTVTKTMANYIKLTLNPKIRITVDGVAHLNLEGSYFNGSFGSQNNTLTVQYRYKPENGSYGSWATATATVSNNTYTASPTISGLNYQTRYIFQIKSQDKLMTVPSADIPARALPVFDWSENDFNFNVPVTFSAGFSGLIDLIYPIGSIYMSTNNVSPQTFLGGSWDRIQDKFLLAAGSSYSAGSTGGAATVKLTANQSGLRNHSHGASGSYSGANFYIRHGKSAGTDIVAAGANTSVETGVGATWGNGISTQDYSHQIDRVNIGGSVGVSVNDSGSAEAAEAHNNMPPYLTVYMWKRTA